MHPEEVVERARSLYALGMSVRSVATAVGVPERTVHHWCAASRRSGAPRRTRARCFRCEPGTEILVADYAYLLGMYLGDGHITSGRRTHCLWIYCGNDWPGIIEDVRAAVAAVLPGAAVGTSPRQGATAVKCSSNHLTCLFPQHGAGMKHTRAIRLAPWQQQIVDAHPAEFLKGLFHSDGCRATNRIRSRRPDGSVREYVYPRWFFANTSDDIMRMAEVALDPGPRRSGRLGVMSGSGCGLASSEDPVRWASATPGDLQVLKPEDRSRGSRSCPQYRCCVLL